MYPASYCVGKCTCIKLIALHLPVNPTFTDSSVRNRLPELIEHNSKGKDYKD